MQPSAVHRYHPIEVKAAQHLLCNLLDTPQDLLKHLHQCAIYPSALAIFQMNPTSMIGQTSLSIAYGIDVAPRDDPIIAQTDEALQGIHVSQTRGQIYNFIPSCTP